MLDYLAVGPDVFERRTQSLKEPRPEMAWLCSRERLQPYETLEGLLLTRKRGQKMRTRDLWRKEAIPSPESWNVREHQNQKHAYGHEALIPLILLVGSYR